MYDTNGWAGVESSTGPLKSLARGFLAMVAAIWVYSAAMLILAGDALLGLMYLLILVVPVSGAGYLWLQRRRTEALDEGVVQKWGSLLYSFQGAAFACWIYDLATTFYAIDIARVAVEINPLGWPLGALGAMSYYLPTIALSYVLLFKLKQKISLYAAIPMTTVALLMGSMNLGAGAENFNFFVITAWVPTAIRTNLLAVVLAADLVCAAILTRALTKRLSLNPAKLSVAENR